MRGTPIIKVAGSNGSQTMSAIISLLGFHILLPVIEGHQYSGYHMPIDLPEPLVLSDLDGQFMGVCFSIDSPLGFKLEIEVRLDKHVGREFTTCDATDKVTGIVYRIPIQLNLRSDMEWSDLRERRRDYGKELRKYPESQQYAAAPKPEPTSPPFQRSSLATNLLLLM